MGLKGKYGDLKPYCALEFDSKEHTAIDVINNDEYFTCDTANSYIRALNLQNQIESNAKVTLISY